jgi:hypothetical protein
MESNNSGLTPIKSDFDDLSLTTPVKKQNKQSTEDTKPANQDRSHVKSSVEDIIYEKEEILSMDEEG